jgi:lysophospholipase L1-like esterase
MGAMKKFLGIPLLLWMVAVPLRGDEFYLKNGQRVLFLGDSITQDGRYVEMIEAWIIQNLPGTKVEIVKLGLSSETVEGLTEPDHPFPRPNIHDRVNSALEKARPDIVVVCYGMNDGIYHPFSTDRFAAFQKGILGLVDKISRAGAKAVLLTPPVFDPAPISPRVVGKDTSQFGYQTPYINYDSEVLTPYGRWIISLSSAGPKVVDVHTPMLERTKEGRKTDPRFTLAQDGIHPADEGHWIMARSLLEAWDAANPRLPRSEILRLIHEKWQVLGPAWLSRVGHKRNPPPVDFDAARNKAAEIEIKAREAARNPASNP